MFESMQRVELFQQMIYCAAKLPLWTYTGDGNLFTHTPEVSNLWEQFFLLENTKNYAMEYATHESTPLVLTNSLNMMWIAAFEKENNELKFFHVIGPLFVDDISVKSMQNRLDQRNLPLKMKRDFLTMIQALPIFPLTSFLQYGLMLHFCITKEDLSVHQFHYQTVLSEETGHHLAQEQDNRHGTWAMEQTMSKLVEDGNLNFREIMQKISTAGTIGKLSVGDPLRQAKNAMIAGIVLVSRAAMRGGLYPELAYTLSDMYIQSVESSMTISEAMNVHPSMMADFVQRVHEVKEKEYPSSFVKKCRDYIAVHIYDELSLEDLSEEMGYTPYYLSRKFKEEAGVDLRIYIRDARLEYAKDLLKYSNDSIHDISEKLHFCSQSYFTQHFKERFGITPAQYRSAI